MKSVLTKAKNHSKRMIIHLKRHHRKYLFGALCSGILALIGLHTANTINSIFADAEDHGTDIILQATATESGQTLRINKYFTNDYTVDRWDGITGDLTSNTTHTYSATWTYNITLSLSWTDRWTFTNNYDDNKSLVPMSWTTVTWVQIVYMPTLAEWFWNSADAPWDYFFYFFNADWALTSLPEWSFDTSNITTAWDYFFSCFNGRLVEWWALTNLPAGSFNISNITIAWDHFFSYFNSKWALTSLPTGSFDTSNITSAWNFFFNAFNVAWALTSLPNGSFRLSTWLTTVWNVFFWQFNDLWKITTLPDGSFDTSNITSVWNFFFDEFNGGGWALTSLPEWSFDLSNITTAWNRFFSYFNSNWALTSLPDSFKLNSVWSQSVSWYQNAFKSQNFTLNKNVSALVSWLTAPMDDRDAFSDNQPWRCGVADNWLTSTSDACSITYNSNWGIEITKPTKKYEANMTWVVAWDGISTPTRTGYIFSGWYTAQQWWDLVETVVFPNMDSGVLYAHWNIVTPEHTIQINNGNEMLSLYNQNKSLSCEYNYESGLLSEKIILYVKNNKFYQYSEYSGYDPDYGPYLYYTKVLYKNDKIYWWWSFFGSWVWIHADYDDFDLEEEFNDLFDSLDYGEVFMCSTWISDTSIFDLPDWITFYDEDHYHNAYDEDVEFLIIINDTINVWEYTDFTIKVIKDDSTFKDYTGTVIFFIMDENGDYLDSKYYDIAHNWFYDFEENNKWKKTFEDGLRIEKPWTYIFQVEWINWWIWEETITVKWYGKNVYYDDLKYNPNYSDEMNEAYQYAHYYDITSANSIKDAKMDSGLNRIAMAKMLSNYAENVLWIDDFNTNRNCTFKDVSASLDKQYDNWVTRACQLWIMWVNMPNNKFYPYWWVTRAEFATALSRLLYDTEDWEYNYYSTHINKLRREWIITNTNPKLREKRWYVMLMLMRASEDYDY